jgi:hypothetical protein
MNPTEVIYPVFEANQVLTNAHLNDLFEYLDEQTRLTRSNLIGIGIACGLEVTFEAPGTVHLSKGCGVTSQGYLIVEPTDLDLAFVRSYTLPIEYGYPPFVEPGTNPAEQFDLWELFLDDDEPGAQPLATSGLVLEDKAVLLFLELRKDGLRNCSPNNCDDRGAEVTATVRRLLIDVTDLDKVIEATSAAAATYLGADLTERLALPDLRMPRFDVPNSGPVAPEEVLFAFQATFRQNHLVAATAAALTDLYGVFNPLVVDEFPNNPFATFTNRFGFLDTTPATTAQVRFMQYYWDLFDDLLAAYDELRWKGVDLMCACCPPEGLFPRHLMAGVLDPTAHDAADYRHHFVPSPAVGDCEDRTREVRQLFRRLVAIVESFSEAPPDKGIRVTPSRWGDAPVSAKAIPYYYDQDGTPPVFELWDPVKTARQRANLNLSYRADQYSPAPPAFVSDALRFDLEPNNFLRIEGHLGKNVQDVLETLLSLKKSHRLPIEVIALRTGAFDENIEVDLSKEECRFQDLETLYEALKSELVCFLVKQVEYFYALPDDVVLGEEAAEPTLWLLKTYAPDFVAQPGTLGRRIEAVLSWRPGQPSPRFIFALPGMANLPSQALALVGAMSDLATRVTDDIRQMDFTSLGDRYRTLVEIARQMDEFRQSGAYDQPGLSDRLDDIVFRCRLDPFEALAEEYKRRVREVKQAQFLSHFLERHPGIQHKAGVPLGGTFILVYHELPEPARPTEPGPEIDAGELFLGSFSGGRARRRATFELDERQTDQLNDALARIQYKAQLAEDPDLQLVYQVFTGNRLVPRVTVSSVAEQVYLDTIAQLPEGTVIADFFLPYECCSDCAPIEYRLPSARLRVTASKTCTNVDGFAEVTLATEGASGALSVQVDGGAFEEMTGPLLLGVGDHTIVVRDATGNESSPVEITIPPQLVIGASETNVDQAAGTYQVVFAVEGGTPPYLADPGTIVDTTYTSPVLPVAEVLTVVVTDAVGCTVEGTFDSGVEPCDLPCEGAAVRQGYRFWLPEARPNLPINEYKAEVGAFVIRDPDGNPIELTAEVNDIVNQAPHPIRTSDYADVVQRWVDKINDLVAGAVGSDQWFRLEYEPAPETGTTGTLFVDRITCIDFSLELVVDFIQGKQERHLELAYNSRGTVVVDPTSDTKFRIPPFGGSTSNKCRPEEPPVPQCEGTDLELEIRREGAFPDVVVLMAATAGGDQPVAFLWEVQDGIPSVAGGAQVAVKFEPPEPVEKLVRLTAFTEKGCTVTVEEVIDIFKPEG